MSQTSFSENQTHMTLFDEEGFSIFEDEVVEGEDVFEPFEEQIEPPLYLQEGSVFVRKYTIEKFLGQGALGIAYVAVEEGSYNRVVIKEFFPKGMVKREADSTIALDDHATEHQRASYAKMKEVFEEEAQNIVTINQVPHKNVAGFVSLEREVNNTVYYLMPYSEGEELGDYLKRLKAKGHHLSQKEIMRLVEPILNGLSHIHHYGIYHKDIKPANIYIRKDDEPLLIDFGASVTSAHLLTPSYAPIEQVKRLSSEYGAYTDLYALGVMMYEMVVESKPPKSTLRASSIARGERDPYQPLAKKKELKGRFEKHFLEAIDHALALSYQERPQSAKELKEELRGDIQRKKRNRLVGFLLLTMMIVSLIGYKIYDEVRDKFGYLIVPHTQNGQLLVDNRLIEAQKDGRYRVLVGRHIVEIKNSKGYLSKVTEIELTKEKEQQRIANPLIKKEVILEVRTQKDLVAEVFLNGEFVGKTPYRGKLYYENLEKKYTILVQKEGYADAKYRSLSYQELMAKEKNLVTLALRKKEGSVEIKSPVGFKVKVNGHLLKDKNGRIEITPLIFKRPQGLYRVLLYSSKRKKGIKLYEHIVRNIEVKDRELTLFPQIKAKKSQNYLRLQDKEAKRKISKKENKEIFLSRVKLPQMGKLHNGIRFAKHEVSYDELVRFLNSVQLNSKTLRSYFEVRANSLSKYIKRKVVDGKVQYSIYKGYENYPVVQISWYGAKAYIDWLNEKSQGAYRLPTQYEWESVARVTTIENSSSLHVVGTTKESSLGLYDIFGNVAEWGEDDFGEFSKVVLGGSYRTLKEYFSPTMQNSMNGKNHKNADIGFRVVQ